MKYTHLILLLALLTSACNKPQKNQVPQEDTMYSWVKEIKQCPKEADYSPKHLDAKSKELFTQALALENKNTYKHAAKIKALYEQSAKLGNPFSMNNLVNLYYYGYGTEIKIDEKQALYWSQEINKLGIPMGDYAMAQVYELGIGVAIDHKRSYYLYNKAAKRGNPDAQYIIGKILIAQSRNYKDAYRLWECAVNRGHKAAAFELALNYKTDDNFEKAYQAYRKGAKIGSKSCINALKEAYAHIEGYPTFGLNKDIERAICLRGLGDLLKKKPELTFPDLDERCPANVKQPANRD